MRNPQDTTRLVSSYQNDGLHPDSTGHRKMGESVDLNLFTGEDTVFQATTGVNSVKAAEGYELGQNYPNPLSSGGGSPHGGNRATTISFRVPTQSFVSLKVFDTLGREVSTLISEQLSASTYSRQWNTSGLSSGFYFYRLVAQAIPSGQAGECMETKKMIVSK